MAMERLPTELITQILGYMSTNELKDIGLISSEYRYFVLPMLFRRIRPCPWGKQEQGMGDLIACLQNNAMLSSAVRVLDARDVRHSKRPVEVLRRIMETTTQWEELVLSMDDHLPLAVLDDNTKLQLRRLRCFTWRWSTGPKFYHLLLDILPTCTNLVEIWVPGLKEEMIKAVDPGGLAAATWVNRLQTYGGPSYPLNYLHNSTPLYHLTCTTEIPSTLLQRLGGLVGQQLLHLHCSLSVTKSPDTMLIRDAYLPPSLIPSLFPNLRYVAWFLIMSQPGSIPGDLVRFLLVPTSLLITHIQDLPRVKSSGDEAALDTNGHLLHAIQQLHFLREVCFVSLHTRSVPSAALASPAMKFVNDVQMISPPSLQAICLWAPYSEPRSYGFRKEGVESTNEGSQKLWVCEENVLVPPLCQYD